MASDLVAAAVRRFDPRRVVCWAAQTVVSGVRSFRDRRDERRALRLRASLGQRCWLVSWHREPNGWRARLSCPGLESTLERTSATRAQAINRTARALTQLLNLREQQNAFHPEELGLD